MSWEVIISTNGGTFEVYNKNNNEEIDVGERIRFWNRETRDEGNIFEDSEKYAQELHNLGIRSVPVGTKIRPLQECIKIIQRTRSYAEGGETLEIKNSVVLAKQKASQAGIELDPNLEEELMKLAYQRGIDVFLSAAEREIKEYSTEPRYTQRDMDIALNPLGTEVGKNVISSQLKKTRRVEKTGSAGCDNRRDIANALALVNNVLHANSPFSPNYYDIVGELVFKAREYAEMSDEVIDEQRISEISAAFYRNILCPQYNLAAVDLELLARQSVVFVCNPNQLPAIF